MEHIPGAEFQPDGYQVSYTFTHLPTWAMDALRKYEADIAAHKITFESGRYADFDGDDWWLRDHLAAHIASLEIEPHNHVGQAPDNSSQITTGRSGPRSNGSTETGGPAL